MKCLFCGELIPPGSRAYLRTREDEVKHVIGILKDKYLFSQSEDNFTKFMKDGVVCRRKMFKHFEQAGETEERD